MSAADKLMMMGIAEDVIISSEMIRARETAHMIAEKLEKSTHTFSDIHEHYFGDFRLKSSASDIPPDAESQGAFQERIHKAFCTLLSADTYSGKRKIIVSHGLVFKHLTILLTGRQETINFGEVFLFTPVNGSWITKRVHP